MEKHGKINTKLLVESQGSKTRNGKKLLIKFALHVPILFYYCMYLIFQVQITKYFKSEIKNAFVITSLTKHCLCQGIFVLKINSCNSYSNRICLYFIS